MQHKRIYYLDVLRIIASLAVIIIHVSSQSLYYSQKVSSLTWQSLNFWTALMRWGVPIFVMISGVLFLDPNKKMSIQKLFTKHISRIVWATIFWHLFYTGYTFFFEDHSHATLIKLLIKGYSHLWFLHMLLGLYLLVPLLRKITQSLKLSRYFLILTLFFTILLPSFKALYINLLPLQFLSPVLKTICKSFFKLTNSFYFDFTLGFSGYFVAGYYFNQINLAQKSRYLIYSLGILGLLSTIIGTSILSIYRQKRVTFLYNYTSLNVFLATIAIFILVKNVWPKHATPKTDQSLKLKKLVQLSNLTFGIYLIHFLFVRLLTRNLSLFKIFNNAFIAVPIISLIVFILAALTSWLLKQIPWLKKHVL